MVWIAVEGLSSHADRRTKAVNGRFVRQFCGAFFALAIAFSALLSGQPAFAQVTIVQDGKPVQLSKEQMKAMRQAGPPGMPPGAQPTPQPGQEAKPEDKDKKKEGEDAKKKESEATVKRPEKPPRVPDPREFNVK